MLNEQQLADLLEMQDQMNARVNPDWLGAGYQWLRAALVEGAEAIEHHGWKWWKKQTCDLPQLQLELVDIWHFWLSQALLEADGDARRAGQRLLAQADSADAVDFDGRVYSLSGIDLLRKLELLVGLAAARRLHVPLFASIMADCDLTWNQLYQQYVGKNTLNLFRQDHGYKEGTYRKIWAGREDNDHLVEIAAALDPARPGYRAALYAQLQQRYATTG